MMMLTLCITYRMTGPRIYSRESADEIMGEIEEMEEIDATLFAEALNKVMNVIIIPTE
jgi:hypothetical protein